MIRILVIDNLSLVRESLAVALATITDMELECCSNIEEGIEILRRQPGSFDVVLLKQTLDGEKADELLSFTNQNGLHGRVLILTPRLGTLERRRLADLGVAGIFAKQRSLQDLIGAIQDVASGRTYFDKPSAKKDHRPDRGLTGQERRAAELVFEGLTNKEIGARMGVSESYVKAVLQRVFLKMGVRSRGQLVRALLQPTQARPDWPLLVSQPAALQPDF